MRRPVLILLAAAATPYIARKATAIIYPRVFRDRMETARQHLAAGAHMDNAERELRGLATHP